MPKLLLAVLIMLANQAIAQTYCKPTSNCGSGDLITKVVFNTINRSSGCDSANGYGFYSTPSNTTTVYKGNAYLLSVTVGPVYLEGIVAWIDYNQNKTFETSERLVSINGVSACSARVLIPATALTGQTRLRIRCVYNTSSTVVDTISCGNVTYGETEDYLVTIEDSSCTAPTTGVSGITTGCGSVALMASGGTSYLWSGGNSPTSAANTFTTSGKYYVQVKNAAGCSAVDSQTVSVTPNVIPDISIYTYSSTTICPKQGVQFYTSYYNGGTAPGFRWTINNKNVSGATLASYYTDSLKNGDTVRCILTSNATCATPTTATSSPIIVTVLQIPPKPEIIITASDTAFCSGKTVTFTSALTNRGSFPSYQWQKNGVNISGATDSTYSSSALASNDLIRCIYKNNFTCPVGDTSNAVKMSVTTSVSPAINISSPVQTSCSSNRVKRYQFSLLSNVQPEDLSSGSTTIFPAGRDDDRSAPIQLPFNFKYAGVVFSKFSVSVNGILGLGDTALFSGAVDRQIFPYSTDLHTGTNGSVRYKTVSTNGNQKLVVEWNVRLYGYGSAFDRTIQAWLFEGSNNIQFVYGNKPATNGSAAVGVEFSGTDYLYINPVNNLADSTNRHYNFVWPPAGVSYHFSPCANNAILCTNTSVTFTAVSYNGGTAPTYQWFKNATAVAGANATTFTTASLSSRDVISCRLISNAVCTTSDTAFSNAIRIDSVASAFTPMVQITASPSDSITQGNSVTFTATPTYGGSSPTYQWKVNGINRSSGNVFTASDLKHRDTVICELASSLSCASPQKAQSNPVVMYVDYCQPIVSFPSTGYYIKNVTFNSIHRNSTLDGSTSGAYSYYATDTNATTINPGSQYALSVATITGFTYVHRMTAWIDFNRNNVFDTSEVVFNGASPSSVTSHQFSANVSVPTNAVLGTSRLRVRFESINNLLQRDPCKTINYGETEDYKIEIANAGCTVLPTINITGDSTACDTVRLTASGGTTYLWSGGVTPNSAANKFITSGTYQVQVTDPSGCTATKTIQVTVQTSLKPEVSIAPNDTSLICSATPVLFTATATNAEASAIYRWIRNGTTLVDTSANRYRFESLNINDVVTCIVFNKCKSDTSSYIARIVSGTQAPTITITASPADTIDYGDQVTFRAYPVLGGTAPAFQWKLNGANVGNNSATYITSSLTNNTQVSCVLTSNAGCASPKTAASNVVTMRVGYCIPGVISSCTGEHISNVTLNTIRRNSACDGGYSYFSTDTNTTKLNKGNNYILTVKTAGQVGVAAWIDYNQNRMFETSERILSGYNGTVSFTYATGFIVPSTILKGATRLRVRCTYAGSPGGSPCGSTTWGETEDYLITIDSAASDLVVDSITIPPSGFQNKPLTVKWKVKNRGEGATFGSAWTDRVFVSANPVFSAGTVLSQHDFAHNGVLQPDSSYIKTQDIVLPPNISGPFYIHVFTDASRQIAEYNPGGEANNVSTSAAFEVQLKMPPDLTISSLTIPMKLSAGQKANIRWTVKNQGDSSITVSPWADKVYLSTSPTFDSTAILAGAFVHTGGLAASTEYNSSYLITIPQVASGNYYIFVVTDADKVAAEWDETNNIRRSLTAIPVGVPDLAVSFVSIPSSVGAGQKLRVNWTVRNAGNGAIENASWTDRIFLSPQPVYTPGNAIWFDVSFPPQILDPNGTMNRQIDLNVPDIVSGQYYAYVYTDFPNAVYEDTSEHNNVRRSTNVSNITTGLPVRDAGVSEVITPKSDCGLTTTETVKIKITNYGNLVHTGFNVGYQVDNGPVVIENIGSLALLPSSTLQYSFTAKANLSTIGSYTLKVFTRLPNDTTPSNDTLVTVIRHYPPLAQPTNLLPLSGAINLSKAVNFSWGAVTNATKYDLYLWKSTDTVPSTPLAANITQINYSYSGVLLVYGLSYNWKVVAKSDNCETASTVRSFSLRHLPDLVVDSIIVPANGGVSETAFSLSWITKNRGLGTTGSANWYERVYISESSTNRSMDSLLGAVTNRSALGPDTSYPSAQFTFRVPQGYQGVYYMVIKTDAYNNVEETTDTNNIRVIPINIQLSPWPDLGIDTLAVNPSNPFSEDSFQVRWVVKNHGRGPTTTTVWADAVYLSKSRTFGAAGQLLMGTYYRTGALDSGATYSKTVGLKLPKNIEGGYFIHVKTDVYGGVYEYVWEENNTALWDSLNVIMRPTPNLVITSVSVANDTATNGQSIPVQHITKNEGAVQANPVWTDHIRFTADTANGYTAYTGLGWDPLESTCRHASLSIL